MIYYYVPPAYPLPKPAHLHIHRWMWQCNNKILDFKEITKLLNKVREYFECYDSVKHIDLAHHGLFVVTGVSIRRDRSIQCLTCWLIFN